MPLEQALARVLDAIGNPGCSVGANPPMPLPLARPRKPDGRAGAALIATSDPSMTAPHPRTPFISLARKEGGVTGRLELPLL